MPANASKKRKENEKHGWKETNISWWLLANLSQVADLAITTEEELLTMTEYTDLCDYILINRNDRSTTDLLLLLLLL